MHERIRVVVPVVLIASLLGGWWWFSNRPTTAEAAADLSGSGTIEAEEVMITAEVAGRIQALAVDEGQQVAAGEVLAQLDTALLEAQLASAQAAVEAAEANLALLEAGTRPEEIDLAEAVLAQARASRDGAAAALEHAQASPSVAQAETAAAGAYTVWQNALASLENPQELQVQIDAARAQLDAAQRRLETLQAGARPEDKEQARLAVVAAQNNYWAANLEFEEVQANDKASDRMRTAAELRLEAARVALAQAQANYDKLLAGPTAEELAAAQTAVESAQRSLNTLLAIRENPQSLRAQADSARAQYHNAAAAAETAAAAREAQADAAAAQLAAAEASIDQSEARLALARAGARAEQIRVAEAAVAQARAQQRQIEVQIAKATLTAPRAGIVLTRPVHEGEQAMPGAALMTIGSLDTVRLTLYIPETDIGRVRLGQQVNVTVDSFPERVFTGEVTYIAQDAQFTPRNVQTKEERATTVFAVRVELENADHALKPGMPADGVILESSEG